MPFAFLLISAFLLKHYLADFVLQPPWMLRGKGRLTSAGGYVHAALHAVGTAAILVIAGAEAGLIAMLAAAEFVVHYAIDFAKDRIAERSNAEASPRLYWKLHGLDQFAHQMTYVAIAYVAVSAAA